MISKDKMNEIMDYIMEHLEEDLTVESLAKEFHYSEYYFCRSFKAATGDSIYAFIKRLKMDQSAIDLKLKQERSVTEIGLDYGYSASNYSTVFRKHHKTSPKQFRSDALKEGENNPFHQNQMEQFKDFHEYEELMSIANLKDIPITYQRVIDSYDHLKIHWYELLDRFEDQLDENILLIEKFYQDPAITDANQCICDLCVSCSGEKKIQLENETTLPGGLYAVYHFQGKIEQIYGALQGVFCVWMPQSRYEMDERFGFNIYRNIDRINGIVTMEMYLPVKEKRK